MAKALYHRKTVNHIVRRRLTEFTKSLRDFTAEEISQAISGKKFKVDPKLIAGWRRMVTCRASEKA